MFQYGTDGFRNIILKKVVIKKKKDIGVCYRRGDVNQGWFRGTSSGFDRLQQ